MQKPVLINPHFKVGFSNGAVLSIRNKSHLFMDEVQPYIDTILEDVETQIRDYQKKQVQG